MSSEKFVTNLTLSANDAINNMAIIAQSICERGAHALRDELHLATYVDTSIVIGADSLFDVNWVVFDIGRNGRKTIQKILDDVTAEYQAVIDNHKIREHTK